MVVHQSHITDVETYVEEIANGSVNVGRLERYAVERYLHDVETADERGYFFCTDSALDAIDFFPFLSHTKGEFAGEPFHLRPFQKFVIWQLFGWKRKDNGFRRFRKLLYEVARGNGKSPFGAAIGNLLFVADDPIEARGEIYSYATKQKQARIIWEEARKQIESNPTLNKLVTRFRDNMHINADPYNGSKFEPLGSDSDKNDGLIPHASLIDEFHAWRDYHRGLYETIQTAMGKRRQPLEAIFTTAGSDDSVLWIEQYDYACSVLTPGNGIDSDTFLIAIYEVDADRPCGDCGGDGCEICESKGVIELDPLDESLWHQANPMLRYDNSPVKIDHLRNLAEKAQHVPSERNTFRRYHANQQVASYFKLISRELWAKGSGELPELDGMSCHLGFDWGWRDDLAALAAIFPDPLDSMYYCKIWAWLPQGTERDLTREPWNSFIKNGWLAITTGDVTDTTAIYSTMESVIADYDVRSIAYDPANAREFGVKCTDEWNLNATEMPQNCRHFNEPTRQLLTTLQKNEINHGNNPLLAWCAANVSAKLDGNEYMMPYKVKSADKIDPIVALIMALRESLFAEPATECDLYF